MSTRPAGGRRPQAMLKLLRIINFAVVSEATIEFDEGLNLLTGETGAG